MIDLHVHSTMSDGTYTPSQLIKLAKDKGLKAIALTDHDTIYGNKESYEAAKKYDMEFIHGMELSLNYNNHQIHVVALGFDEESKAFKDFYHELRQKKQSSIVSVIDYLQKQGLDISVEKVEPFIAGGALDKYAILRYLVSDKSKAGDIQYLWDRYIDPAFNNLNLKITENPKAEDAIQAMKKAGAVTSLAHFHKKIGFKNYTKHTAALDPKTAAKVLETTDTIVNSEHLTTLMITHNMRDAIAHGNRLIMMNAGHVIYDVAGEEKKHLTVQDLLAKFEEAAGGELANDRMILS